MGRELDRFHKNPIEWLGGCMMWTFGTIGLIGALIVFVITIVNYYSQ